MNASTSFFDVIVIGGGHAGIEAANICAKLSLETALFTLSKDKIGHMPCNTAIGGTAKGIVVREIDALGGIMGSMADKNVLQMKMLNTSKGASVQCLRAQVDKISYPKTAQKILGKLEQLTIIEKPIMNLIIENNKICGVTTSKKTYNCSIVILTTGTYMASVTMKGDDRNSEGPDNQKTFKGLSNQLKALGFKLIRLKTGTPPRIEDSTISYSNLEVAPGSKQKLSFSFWKDSPIESNDYIDCFITRTTPETKQIILDNLSKSSMYNGTTVATGPRYCPSIEDKIVRFTERDTHQLFLERESMETDSIYLQGLSTSLPNDVQAKILKTIPGLEKAKALKWGYAIEYDAIYPTQLNSSLETKIISNLFCAGQVNGTSGYEEAAAQGLIAGINASQKLKGKSPLVLKRNEAYIGVLIDDLTTKGTNEPYRLLTSTAEYRLLLRNDNADKRLFKHAFEVGTINEKQYQKVAQKYNKVTQTLEILKDIFISPSEWNKTHPSIKIKNKESAYQLLKKNDITIEDVLKHTQIKMPFTEAFIVSTEIKYAGYLAKQDKHIKEFLKKENMAIPKGFNYQSVLNFSSETKKRFCEVQPLTIGQASRIQGINPSDVFTLMYEIKKLFRKSKI